MATLAAGGRIGPATVEEEIARVTRQLPREHRDPELAVLLGADFQERFDLFELAQLKEVISVCRESSTLAEAGKKLFAVSRRGKRSVNDSDRLSKYLARFGLEFRVLRNGGV